MDGRDMLMAVDPYEFGGGSLATAAALLLGDAEGGVLTARPSPFDGESAACVRDAAANAPSYSRLVESWRWSAAYWRCGLVRVGLGGRELARGLSSDASAIGAMTGAGDLLRWDVGASEAEFLERVSRDIVRGGADPAVRLALTSVVERLAAECGAAMVTAERETGIRRGLAGARRVFSVVMPLVLGASSEAVLRVREALAGPLERLREEMAAVLRDETSGSGRLAAAEEVATKFREMRRGLGEAEGAVRMVVMTGWQTREGVTVGEAMERIRRVVPVGAESSGSAGLMSVPRRLWMIRVRASAWDAAENGAIRGKEVVMAGNRRRGGGA